MERNWLEISIWPMVSTGEAYYIPAPKNQERDPERLLEMPSSLCLKWSNSWKSGKCQIRIPSSSKTTGSKSRGTLRYHARNILDRARGKHSMDCSLGNTWINKTVFRITELIGKKGKIKEIMRVKPWMKMRSRGLCLQRMLISQLRLKSRFWNPTLEGKSVWKKLFNECGKSVLIMSWQTWSLKGSESQIPEKSSGIIHFC